MQFCCKPLCILLPHRTTKVTQFVFHRSHIHGLTPLMKSLCHYQLCISPSLFSSLLPSSPCLHPSLPPFLAGFQHAGQAAKNSLHSLVWLQTYHAQALPRECRVTSKFVSTHLASSAGFIFVLPGSIYQRNLSDSYLESHFNLLMRYSLEKTWGFAQVPQNLSIISWPEPQVSRFYYPTDLIW